VLRKWQVECIQEACVHYKTNKYFFCLASPGAGKTVFAATLAKLLNEEQCVDLIICISPSTEVARKTKETIEHIFSRRLDGALGSIGVSLTYQKLSYLSEVFWDLFDHHRVFVILDEVHHLAGDVVENTNAWGEQVLLKIKDKATKVLMMSGTPWRSDLLPITLSQYDEQKEIICNYVYGLREAIADGVCCIPKIELIDNSQIIVKSSGKVIIHSNFSSAFRSRAFSYSQLIQYAEFIKHILVLSDLKLQSLRSTNPLYGGLIVAATIEHAHLILDILQSEMMCSAVLVHSGQQNAAQIIENFRTADTEWIVSVGMISEGTDIPRLKVCCYLSDVKTEMYFRQVLGRIIRVTQNKSEEAWLYMLNQSTLRKYAEQVQFDLPQYRVVSTKSSKDAIDMTSRARNHSIDADVDCEIKLSKRDFFKIEIIGTYTSKLLEVFIF